MGGAVFPPRWLFGLRCPSTGAYRLLGGARSWWENGRLPESSCQWELPRTTTASVFVPAVSHTPPSQETLQYQQVGLAQTLTRSLLFSLGPSHTRPCVCPLRVEFVSSSPVEFLWQTPVAFKARFSGGSSSHCQTPRLGSLMWVSELSLLWLNFCDNYFPVCGLPTGPVWDLILSQLHPFYHLLVALCLWM